MDSQQIVNIRKHLPLLLFFFFNSETFLKRESFQMSDMVLYTVYIREYLFHICTNNITNFFFKKKIHTIFFFFFFLTLLDRHHCMGFSLVATSGSYSLVVCGLLIVVVCPVSGSEVKASAWNAGDQGSILGSGRSPEEGNGNPLQYSCLENPMEEGAW